jgi:hypothetical protein
LQLRPELDESTKGPLPRPHSPPILLNVAVTGHRSTVLTAPIVRSLRPAVYTVFSQIRGAALRLQDPGAETCISEEPRLHLHTALASGADQIAAICARSSGYYVRATLPFEAQEYRNDFAAGDELDMFEQAVAVADEVVALPGNRSDPEGAYVRVGKLLVRSADIMIAIWDGELGRGPGGTAHVVELALRSSVPVIHIDIDHRSDKIRMRTLVRGGSAEQYSESMSDPLFYNRVLSEVFQAKFDRGARATKSLPKSPKAASYRG